MTTMATLLRQAERGALPDPLVRWGIRRLLAQRLQQEHRGGVEAQAERYRSLLAEMDAAPIAPRAEIANEQHYEVPPELFHAVLGPRLKYSGCLWRHGTDDLADAEAAMLELTCRRADLQDGQRILELGCGWGSLSLWMAEHFPNARIEAVSNSQAQRRFIESRRDAAGATNLTVRTADINTFVPESAPFDRVVSVEMFEHMRNWRELMRRIHEWLQPGGRFFAHVFCHARLPYRFIATDETDWMARHFFTEGLMPADDLFLWFQDHLQIEERWRVNGRHYARTQDAWLARLDASREALLPLLRQTYGDGEEERWFQRWRLFFLACSELFGYRGGNEWYVGHFRMSRPGRAA